MKLNENAMKLTNENNFTGNEFCIIPYGKGYEKAMKFGVPNEILTFHGFSFLISLAFIGYPSSSDGHLCQKGNIMCHVSIVVFNKDCPCFFCLIPNNTITLSPSE